MTGAIMAAAAASADATPDPVNWANISGGLGGPVNADQTISGINVQITLRATISNVATFNAGGGLLVYVNGDQITGSPSRMAISSSSTSWMETTCTSNPR